MLRRCRYSYWQRRMVSDEGIQFVEQGDWQGEGCTSEEKEGKAVKEQIKGGEKAKKRFIDELKKQVKA